MAQCSDTKNNTIMDYKEATKDIEFKFGIGDVVEITYPSTVTLKGNPGRSYGKGDKLHVVFRWYDGDTIYLGRTDDGFFLSYTEQDLELVEAAHCDSDEAHEEIILKEGRLIDDETYEALERLGILGASVRSHNVGNSDYSRHIIQPWSIWIDYELNAWDADIVKRILRTKKGESRRLDYEKIIHICQERIRQIDNCVWS